MNRRGFFRLVGGAAAVAVAPKPLLTLAAPELSPVLGLQYWQEPLHSGTLAGIERTIYPGRFSTPTINGGGGGVLTAALVRRCFEIQKKAYE